MKLGEFEQMVYEQMIAEYPKMEEEGAFFVDSQTSREFKDVEEVIYYLCNQMWDAFDETLDFIDDKGEHYG